jgi:cytochrome c peroxidase
MAHYAQGFLGAGVEWNFLTTRSEVDLQPILKSYQQPLDQEIDEQGRFTGRYSHLLRVFLIDRQKLIRNIYTVSVLHPDLLVADVTTLLLEQERKYGCVPSELLSREAQNRSNPSCTEIKVSLADRLRPGDDKTGYEQGDYRTHSVALTQRQGAEADLYRLVQQPIPGLPKLRIPNDNPLNREKIALGRKLFYDRRLSLNNTFSCAMCHIPEQGFTSQEQATAIGIEGQPFQGGLYKSMGCKRNFTQCGKFSLL